MLDLDGTTAGERVGVLDEAKGIEKIEGSGVDTKTIGGASISGDGGVDASLLNGSEGGGGADEGKGDGRLHFDVRIFIQRDYARGTMVDRPVDGPTVDEIFLSGVSSWFNLKSHLPSKFSKDLFQPERHLIQADGMRITGRLAGSRASL